LVKGGHLRHATAVLIYLGKKREPAARQLSANYKSLLAFVEEMTLLNMELLRRNAWD
jgi:hypothetical protein